MATQHKQKEQEGLLYYQEELEQVEVELSSVEISLQELLDRQHELTLKRSELKAIIEQNVSSHDLQKDLDFWSGTDFDWTKEIDLKLKHVFGLKELRPMQRQTMNATMSGKDCLLIMPTGGGKSLCFQLPAVVSKGLTLVVSPLVSLMEDQQMALEQLSVPSAILTASTSKAEQKFVLDDMVKQNGTLRLLYVTPEKLAKSKRFMNKLEKCYSINHLSRLVIDEVHCCSQWGHDFRPDYKFLGIMKRQFPNTPILGLTATATTKVLEDVKKILNIPKALELKASFNRPNLFYEIREKPGTQKESIDAILNLIKGKFRNQSGIVYCFSRKESEELATDLSSRGIDAGCYHGDMDPKSRSLVHRRWLEGTVQVVVATIAFGMGIDKPDVRFVIHHSISKSMENLYQESGRAGRDGKRSDCIVFYRLADVIRQSCMVFTEQTGLSNLHGIVKYCTDVASCRRSVIARHFGEVWDGSQCADMCDMCSRNSRGGGVDKRDMTRHCTDVVAILDAASSTDQRVTAIKLVDAWFGKGSPGLRLKSVKPPSITKATAERVLAHMLVHDYLNEDFHFTAYSTICYIVPGPKARMIRNKIATVRMDFPLTPSASKSKSPTPTSSSTSSSSPKPTQSPTTNGSSPNKPKLVVINMEKSHFNSLSVPSASSSSKKSSSSSSSKKSSSSLKKSSSLSSSSWKTSSLSLSRSFSVTSHHPPQVTSDDEGLNFDDDDDKVTPFSNSKQSAKQTTALSSTNPKCVPVNINKKNGGDSGKDKGSVVLNNGGGGDLSDGGDVVSAENNRSKRKRMIISSDDESDNNNDDANVSDEELLASCHSPQTKTGSRLSLDKRRKREDKNDSIVISDDDDDFN